MFKKMTLWEETLADLKMEGLNWDDVLWVGTSEWVIPKEDFKWLANVYYNKGYGSAEVAADLVVVTPYGWLSRREYDGSEWWEWNTPPIRPKEIAIPKSIVYATNL